MITTCKVTKQTKIDRLILLRVIDRTVSDEIQFNCFGRFKVRSLTCWFISSPITTPWSELAASLAIKHRRWTTLWWNPSIRKMRMEVRWALILSRWILFWKFLSLSDSNRYQFHTYSYFILFYFRIMSKLLTYNFLNENTFIIKQN